MYLAQDRDKRRVVVKTPVNFWITPNGPQFLTDWKSINLSRTLFY